MSMPITSTAARQRAKDRRAATERSILDAVESLLEDRSFRDVAVEDVMGLAGLTRTALYRYFPDRESVLLRLMAETVTELDEASRLWLQSTDPGTVSGEAGWALARVYERHGPLLVAFDDAAAVGADIERAWRDTVERYVQLCAAHISELCKLGTAHVADPLETARALVWMTESYLLEVFGRKTAGAMTAETASEVLATIWRRALFSDT
jgi:AcrR family transcriptional regulator